jgi:hypothetical protein
MHERMNLAARRARRRRSLARSGGIVVVVNPRPEEQPMSVRCSFPAHPAREAGAEATAAVPHVDPVAAAKVALRCRAIDGGWSHLARWCFTEVLDGNGRLVLWLVLSAGGAGGTVTLIADVVSR